MSAERRGSMQLCVIAFTGRGEALACRIKNELADVCSCELYTKCKASAEMGQGPWDGGMAYVQESLTEWVKNCFLAEKPILFIGACGIAVRAIAPVLRDKLTDVAVLVAEESGQYVIPVLSGHYGGANALAKLVAERIGATAVITTATDVNGLFGVDVFAADNRLRIVNREGIAKVSSALLAGEQVRMKLDGGYEGEVPQEVHLLAADDATKDISVYVGLDAAQGNAAKLWLLPKALVLGIGCKQGKTKDEIETFVRDTLAELGLPLEAVCAVASIDRKSEEPGICELTEKYGLTFLCYTAEELTSVPGNFTPSAFVKSQVGVDNVCERAAMAAAGAGGRLRLGKTAVNGITLAVAERQWSVRFDEA